MTDIRRAEYCGACKAISNFLRTEPNDASTIKIAVEALLEATEKYERSMQPETQFESSYRIAEQS